MKHLQQCLKVYINSSKKPFQIQQQKQLNNVTQVPLYFTLNTMRCIGIIQKLLNAKLLNINW